MLCTLLTTYNPWSQALTVFCCISMHLPCIIFFSVGWVQISAFLWGKAGSKPSSITDCIRYLWQFIWCTLSFYLNILTQKCPYESDMQYIYSVILLKRPITILKCCTSCLFFLSISQVNIFESVGGQDNWG
jgi:hypothetical protein